MLGPRADDRDRPSARPWRSRARPGNGRSTTPSGAPPAPPCGTRWRRRTSTCSSGSSSTAWSSRRRSSSPPRTSFTSFDGQGTISGGNMTEADAKSLALAMEFGSLPGPPQAADHADRLAHPRQVRPAGRTRGRYRRSRPCPALRGAVLPGLGARGDLGAGADGDGAVGHHLGARAYLVQPEFRPGGHHGPHRVHRYHRGLVHRLFRTIKRRDPGGPLHPDLGRPRLQERLADGVGGRLRLPAGRRRPLRGRGGRRQGLRLLPRPVDHHGHAVHLVLHPAAGHPARSERPPAGCRSIRHRPRPGHDGARDRE